MSTLEVDSMLQEMAFQGQLARPALDKIGQGSVPSVRPPKMRYSHKAMADLILENPAITQNEIAFIFGRSPGWVSVIITSDAFQSYYESRRAELTDPELMLTLQERMKGLAAQSLRVLQEKLSKPADQVSDQLALQAASLAAKSLGLGAQPPQVLVTSEERLSNLAHRLIALQGGPKQEVLDVQAREVSRA